MGYATSAPANARSKKYYHQFVYNLSMISSYRRLIVSHRFQDIFVSRSLYNDGTRRKKFRRSKMTSLLASPPDFFFL